MKRSTYTLVSALLLVLLLSITGCGKKQAIKPPDTAPAIPLPLPTATLTTDKTEILAGDSVFLTWNTTNANSVTIEGIGTVPASGTNNVAPTESTSYHLMARGPGGFADATVRVRVNHPQEIKKPTRKVTEEEEFWMSMQDVFYEYDSYSFDEAAKDAIEKDAAFLISRPEEKIVIGGYCDERGSNEYNLALGQSRAAVARKALISAGVDEKRIRIVSYGKEKPYCTQSSEECWQKNRRAGFTLDK